jgi:succinyl-CoA synthetase beta subunit
MRLDEHAAKRLLESYGIVCPAGTVVTSAANAKVAARHLGVPAYIKALTPETNRAARGGVRVITRVDEASDAFTSVTAALSAKRARIERAVAADKWWYVAVLLPTGSDVFELLVSAEGGSGIESRQEAMARVMVDPLIGLRGYHCRRAAALAGLSRQDAALLEPLVARCYEIMVACDLEFLELNPVAVSQNGLVPVDARISVDDYALFRQGNLVKLGTEDQQHSIEADLRGLGVEYVPLGGRIGIVGLGAGLTMHLADWITDEGGAPAFFFDATTAAVRDWPAIFAGAVPHAFANALAYGLDKVGANADVWLVNFTSGGTPVDGLCRGLLAAMSQLAWKAPIVVHVGGNRSEAAKELLSGAGIEVASTLGAAVRQAVLLQHRTLQEP